MYTIYMAKDKVLGKCYIGRTGSKLNNRISWHYSNSKHRSNKMANALKEFGRDGFQWLVLDQTDSREKSYALEAEFIQKYNTVAEGYNTNDSDLIPWNKGKKMSAEYCRRLQGSGNGMYGKTHSEEYRRWRSEHMSKIQLGSNNASARRIYCVELDQTWDCLIDCSNELHIHRDSLSHCCRGVHKTAGGYHFRYA